MSPRFGKNSFLPHLDGQTREASGVLYPFHRYTASRYVVYGRDDNPCVTQSLVTPGSDNMQGLVPRLLYEHIDSQVWYEKILFHRVLRYDLFTTRPPWVYILPWSTFSLEIGNIAFRFQRCREDLKSFDRSLAHRRNSEVGAGSRSMYLMGWVVWRGSVHFVYEKDRGSGVIGLAIMTGVGVYRQTGV